MLRIFLTFSIFIISGCLLSLANDDNRRKQILEQILESLDNEDTLTAINLYKTNITLLHDGSLFEGLARYYYGFLLYKNDELIEAQEEINMSCAIINEYIGIIFNPEISDISELQIFAYPYYYRALLSEHLDNDEAGFMFEKARTVFDLAQLTYTDAYLYIKSSIIQYSEYEKLNKYYEIKRLAIDAWRNDDYVSAMKNLKTCLAILDDFKYTLNREYGIIYQALGHISSLQHNLRDSELFFKQGLLYIEPYSISGGGLHDLCISLYLDLSSTYGQLRDSINARIIMERAYNLCLVHGINNRDYCGIIMNLALLDEDDISNRLEKILDEILVSSELDFNDRALFFFNLAVSYAQIEDWDDYLKSLNRAEEMALHCDDQTLNSKIKYAIGLERFATGDYLAAISNLAEAKNGLNFNSGLAELNFVYAWALYMLGEKRLIKEIKKNTLKFQNDILTQFTFLSEQQRFSLWQSLNSLLNGYNGLLHAKAKSSYKYHKYYSEIYNNVLFSKGLLLNTNNFIKKQVENNKTGESQRQTGLNNKDESRCDSISNTHYNPLSFNLDEEVEKLFMRENLSVSMLEQNIKVHWKKIQKALHKGQAAIEFAQIPLPKGNNSFENEYVAIVLRPEFKTPQAVTLFNEKTFIAISDENIDQLSYSRLFSKLVWGNLEKYLKGCKDVFFSADGVLHQVAIENLPDYSEDALISDRYHIYRVSSTKEVLTNKMQSLTNEAILYGGIKYNNDILTMEKESRKYSNRVFRGNANSFKSNNSTINRVGISFLPFTLKETETIDSILTVNNYKSRLMSGIEASEESLKNLSGQKKSIIHIATHGFYWKENEENKERGNNLLRVISGNAPKSQEDLALTRTGLLMSGATNILSGKIIPDSIDDGILTAMEISKIDLRGLDLAVLSACQSGNGDYTPDGIFGLQRGFKKAGANSILMALWNVDDEATQILMTEFYNNFLNGKSKRESLLAAQKVVRETPGFEDPEYWAVFILLDALN